ncbi:MAG: hypothetical protein WC436_06795 [Candidatus Babeliales bacterium]
MAPKVTILSYIPEYGELTYLIDNIKYIATFINKRDKSKIDQLKRKSDGKLINFLKTFDVKRVSSELNIKSAINKVSKDIIAVSYPKLKHWAS